ncbi:MAG TPA: hypothetical protein PKG60_07590 [Spirochaetota bacterium]|jgi:hypothetical protein|nr:hypothetical protein [Spirochaetota bacterium]HPS88205.1 hypothetical protein [Spirochaetota bacterium]
MKEKRIGPDTIMNIISGISIISWIILVAIFIMVAMSNPTSSGMAASRPGLKGAGPWTTNAIYALLVFLVILSISGILFNMVRLKRKSDKMRLTPIFSGILSIAGLIFMNIK